MRKRKQGRKFGRKRDQRRALMKGLAVNLVEKQRIKTTLAKARELRPYIEKLITKARTGETASFRLLLKYLPKKTAFKLFNDIAPKFKDVPGGYTRILKAGQRKSDGAAIGIIEFAYKVTEKNDTAEQPKK
jgi:large subunit ribosomal protein L17